MNFKKSTAWAKISDDLFQKQIEDSSLIKGGDQVIWRNNGQSSLISTTTLVGAGGGDCTCKGDGTYSDMKPYTTWGEPCPAPIPYGFRP